MSHRELEAWVAHVFARATDGFGGDPNADLGEPDAPERVRLLTAFLDAPGRWLAPYSDAQLARGLWTLVDPGCSSYGEALLDGSAALALRAECVRAIPRLFREVFAARCAPILSHGTSDAAEPLNLTGYMWWDLFPSWGTPHRDIDDELLGAMAAGLALDHTACQESALHGLGHWHAAYPERVSRVIDRWLAAAPTDSLRRYALAARAGCVQ